jgi:integrase
MPRRRASTKGLRPELSERGIWQAVGSVAGKRIRKSLGTRDEGKAVELCAAYEARLWKSHTYGEAAVRTFEEAALSYMDQGGEARYLTPIIKHFKGRAIGTITPAEIRAAASTIYPDAGPATKNRQGIVPSRSVILHAHELGWCGAVRVKQFAVPKSRKNKPVERPWIDAFLRESDRSKLPHLSALVLFMHQTGTRISEALRIVGEHVDLGERFVWLEKTKTDEWVSRELTAELVGRIAGLGPKAGERVFGYTDRSAVNRVMKRICKRAGIERRSTHAAGRHSFATNAIAAGADIKDAMEAGGWKSSKLFMDTYVHARKGARRVAELFDAQTGPVDTLKAMSIESRRATFGKRK